MKKVWTDLRLWPCNVCTRGAKTKWTRQARAGGSSPNLYLAKQALIAGSTGSLRSHVCGSFCPRQGCAMGHAGMEHFHGWELGDAPWWISLSILGVTPLQVAYESTRIQVTKQLVAANGLDGFRWFIDYNLGCDQHDTIRNLTAFSLMAAFFARSEYKTEIKKYWGGQGGPQAYQTLYRSWAETVSEIYWNLQHKIGMRGMHRMRGLIDELKANANVPSGQLVQ